MYISNVYQILKKINKTYLSDYDLIIEFLFYI